MVSIVTCTVCGWGVGLGLRIALPLLLVFKIKKATGQKTRRLKMILYPLNVNRDIVIITSINKPYLYYYFFYPQTPPTHKTFLNSRLLHCAYYRKQRMTWVRLLFCDLWRVLLFPKTVYVCCTTEEIHKRGMWHNVLKTLYTMHLTRAIYELMSFVAPAITA